MLIGRIVRQARLGVNAIGKSSCSCSTSRNLTNLSSEKLCYSEFGDPATVLKREKFVVDTVKDEQIVIKMLASPINPADINTIQGTYAIKPEIDPETNQFVGGAAVGGNEGVGVVLKVGNMPNPLSIVEGDWVIPGSANLGTWRGYLVGWNQDFIPVPKMDLACAATIGVNPPTAFRMLKDFEFLKPGDLVVQNGGNSAVGQMVIQLCREFRLKSVSVVRDRENIAELKQQLKSLGDSNTTVLTDDEFRNTKGIYAQLALNCVGGKSSSDLLRTLAPGRTMVTYGGMSRQPVLAPTGHMIFNDLRLHGFWITRWNKIHSQESRVTMIHQLADLFNDGRLKPPNAKFCLLEDYKECIENATKGFIGSKFIFKFDH